ncbi:MAG: ATP-binding protein [Nannocystaceae bacterium]
MKTTIEPSAFELRFSPSSQLITTVRRFVLSFYTQVLGDHEISSRLAVATHELLENAVAHGRRDEATLAVTVILGEEAFTVEVAIRNESDPDDIREAVRRVESLRGADDVFIHYQDLMVEAAGRTQGSGLGLARIAAESGMELQVKAEGEVIEIRARASYPLPSRAS